MSGSDRDLVAALRAELAGIDPSRECDRDAERAGLAGGARRRADPSLARLELRLARTAPAIAAHRFDWGSRAEHCRMAWLRGLFLAHGSLSVGGSQTHLEILVPPADAAPLADRLAADGLPASWRIRRGRGVITWKSAEMINLVLRRMGAGATLLELEVRQVARTLRGELNRVINAESANLARTVIAAGRQVEAIAALEGDGRLARETEIVRTIAAARRETPEATVTELADRLAIHRSTVQRALERIERLALA